MSNQKPVWREVDGGVPSGTKEAVYIFNGELLEGRIRRGWVILKDSYHAGRTQGGFYNTNRTKVAKYDRMKCDCCFSTGHEIGFDIESGGSIQYNEKCQICNGKGYRLEAVK